MPKRQSKRLLEITMDEFNEFQAEFQSETDRGTAILGIAYLDELLRELLIGALVDDGKEIEKLVNAPGAPLGTLNARIGVAYAMGLISRDELHDLRILQRIRNQFAHDLRGTSFSSQAVSGLCDSLRFGKLGGNRPHWNETPRQKFFATTIIMYHAIVKRSGEFDRRSIAVDYDMKMAPITKGLDGKPL